MNNKNIENDDDLLKDINENLLLQIEDEDDMIFNQPA